MVRWPNTFNGKYIKWDVKRKVFRPFVDLLNAELLLQSELHFGTIKSSTIPQQDLQDYFQCLLL